ncbi:ATP-grasp domain-containing protein [Pseudogracilibacillus sp. SO30301A]|uniref:ATP-grasp domain-containing protein n=1 Tax=Pseudogracilibacillus sp. SO30301A TaxID=3098291 RepID=UPI00300E64BF
MKGWLIYDKNSANENISYIEWFIDEAKQQSIQLELIYRESLTTGIVDGKHQLFIDQNTVTFPDFAVIRTIEPILQVFLEACHIHTFNSSTVSTICNHKILTHMEVNKLRIPMVPTYFTSKKTLPEYPPITYPLVIKEANGRSGKQVHLIKNHKEWKNAFSVLSTNDIMIQSANVELGKDVRVFVIGKEFIGAVLRVNKNDFRANFKLGGDAVTYILNASEKAMVQKIINHFNFGLVGIDFLISKQGELLFNEIEDVVGSRILSEVSDVNLLEKYVTYIKSTLLEAEL